jgi:hypothetical protein
MAAVAVMRAFMAVLQFCSAAVSIFTSGCCASRLARGNAQEQTHSQTSSNYLCTNDGLETGGLPSVGCGDLIAEREFPSDKVYRWRSLLTAWLG